MPDLERDDGLVLGRGAVERGGEMLLPSHSLHKTANDVCVRVIDEVCEEIAGVERRFVAARDDVAEAEAAQIGQQADAQPAALRHDPDITGQPLGIADLLQVGRVAVDRVQDAHAVGAA